MFRCLEVLEKVHPAGDASWRQTPAEMKFPNFRTIWCGTKSSLLAWELGEQVHHETATDKPEYKSNVQAIHTQAYAYVIKIIGAWVAFQKCTRALLVLNLLYMM
jgi:hypothetical protein